MDMYFTTVASEESKHVRWRGAWLVTMVITLIVNSDVINSCKMVSNVAQRELEKREVVSPSEYSWLSQNAVHLHTSCLGGQDMSHLWNP